MKFDLRIPSLKRRIAARTSPARFVRQSLGLKAPRGWGWVTDPNRAAYNHIYRHTTISAEEPAQGRQPTQFLGLPGDAGAVAGGRLLLGQGSDGGGTVNQKRRSGNGARAGGEPPRTESHRPADETERN